VPNYRLEACHGANPAFATVTTLTLRQALRSSRYCLWDEQRRRLVPIT